MLNDEDFLELITKYDYSYKTGDVVQGCIVAVDNNGVLVDISTKACAYCPSYEILVEEGKKLPDIFNIGEKYNFVITSREDEDGVFNLSHKKLAIFENLEIIKQKLADDEIVEGTITNIVKGGAIVSVLGLKGFVPQSQINLSEVKIGDTLEFKILSCELPKGDFILSNKKIQLDIEENAKNEILNTIEEGMVVKGKVVRLTDFGAFVDIGGMDGLLPLSQISWSWIDKPSDVLKLDEVLEVEIIGIDNDKKRISLSLKSLQDNPWLKAAEVVKEEETIKGKVTRVKPFGVFVEVYPSVEGLLNKYQVADYKKATKENFYEGQELDVVIKKFDPEKQKIVLEVVEQE